MPGNTLPNLVTVTIDADSALDLSFAPDANGTATITIRAVDSGGSAVNDTFVVTVTGANDPPQLTKNNLLTVNQGASGVITSALLKATDVEAPRHKSPSRLPLVKGLRRLKMAR